MLRQDATGGNQDRGNSCGLWLSSFLAVSIQCVGALIPATRAVAPISIAAARMFLDNAVDMATVASLVDRLGMIPSRSARGEGLSRGSERLGPNASRHGPAADFTERYAAASGKLDEVRGDVADLRLGLDEASRSALKPIGALLTFVLTVVTLGLWSIVLIYQLNRAWNDRQEFEAAQMGRLNKAWIKLGIVTYPVVFTPDPSKRRNFLLNVILVVITLGIWGIVWDYRVWTDPNSLYPAFHSVEDTVLTIARAA